MKRFNTMFLMGVLTFACAFAAMHQQALDTMTMEVYYASVGKSSEDFIMKQLYPTYVVINKGYLPMHPPLKVDLIPYGDCVGKTLPMDKRKTCALNKVHACALSLSRNENNWTPLNYINCMMTKQEAHDDPPACAVKTCFDDRLMAPCVNTVDGDRLLIAHMNRAIEANVTNVNMTKTVNLPVITFNGVYDEEEQDRARANLLALVCEKTMAKAAICRSPRATETMTHNNFGSGFYYPQRIHCYFWINNWHW